MLGEQSISGGNQAMPDFRYPVAGSQLLSCLGDGKNSRLPQPAMRRTRPAATARPNSSAKPQQAKQARKQRNRNEQSSKPSRDDLLMCSTSWKTEKRTGGMLMY
ncbi:hypothetical protein NDU88_002893 [Pleurodeles waltl]|uniref:Uncharacterized protein n=1 Tax=Pleurodeles waltl TaxID=8319 RepID=A0AAV7NN78_PLEWA|nr:hypothetical protein NDU88_002893 [Pleurodeles waltl]